MVGSHFFHGDAQKHRMQELIKFPVDETGKTIVPPKRIDITHLIKEKRGRRNYINKSYESYEISKYSDDMQPAPIEYRRILKDSEGKILSDEIIDAKVAFRRIKNSIDEVLQREESYHGNPMTELKL